MARRGVSEATKEAAALQAGRRMIARGDRPVYRVRSKDGGWSVDALPWLSVTAASRRDALDAGRAAIAEWLEVPPDAFDLQA
jgi:hypothetical protein